MTESMRALEDGVAGFANNGLKGMAMGLSNNISMIGSLMGGPWGTGLMIGSNALLIGSTLVPMLQKWATGTDDVIKKNKELRDEQRKTHEEAMSQIAERARESNRKQGVDADVQRIINDQNARSDELQREIDAIRKRARESHDQQRIEGMQQDELRKRKLQNDNDIRREQFGANDKELIKEREKENREIERQLEESNRRVRIIKIDQARFEDDLEKTRVAKQQAAAREMEKEKIDEAVREKQQIAERDKERKKAESKRIRDIADATKDVIRRNSPELGDEIDRTDKQKAEIAKFRDAWMKGNITEDEFHSLIQASIKDKEFAPGGSAAAVTAGSTSAYSAIVSAVNGKNQDDFARKQYEEAKKLVPILEKIEKKDPIQVVTVGG